jgi:tRNA A-37 threonylcarbamoyl transferase component Bud32
MRDIKDLIDTVEKYKTALVQKSFKSKKNTVGYVLLNGQPRVLKWYVPGLKQNMETEYDVLKKGFSALSMPSPLEKDTENNVLVMSYIQGINVCDYLNDPQVVFEEKKKAVTFLADWLVAFHTFFKNEENFRIRGDPSLRNFIINRNQVWGIDFEESRTGAPVEDLAGIFVSILSSEPMFTEEKFKLGQILLDSYRKSAKWGIENINAEVSYSLLERIQWRPKDEAILRKYATKIRQKGLHAARHNY